MSKQEPLMHMGQGMKMSLSRSLPCPEFIGNPIFWSHIQPQLEKILTLRLDHPRKTVRYEYGQMNTPSKHRTQNRKYRKQRVQSISLTIVKSHSQLNTGTQHPITPPHPTFPSHTLIQPSTEPSHTYRYPRRQSFHQQNDELVWASMRRFERVSPP